MFVFALDPLFAQVGVFSVTIALVAVAWVAIGRLTRSVDKRLAMAVMVHVVAAALGLGLIAANNRMSRARTLLLAQAVREYHSRYGQYPNGLAALVPEFLPSIPAARYALFDTEFRYFGGGQYAPRIAFRPRPFVMEFYSVESGQWRIVD
jgi:hypothetical protein